MHVVASAAENVVGVSVKFAARNRVAARQGIPAVPQKLAVHQTAATIVATVVVTRIVATPFAMCQPAGSYGQSEELVAGPLVGVDAAADEIVF